MTRSLFPIYSFILGHSLLAICAVVIVRFSIVLGISALCCCCQIASEAMSLFQNAVFVIVASVVVAVALVIISCCSILEIPALSRYCCCKVASAAICPFLCVMIQHGCLHMQLQLYVVVSSNCCCLNSHSTCCCCWQHVCPLSSHVEKGKIVFGIPAEFIFWLFVMLCLSISVLFLEIQFLLVASTVIGHYYLHFCCCCLFQDSHSTYCPLLLVSFNFHVCCMQLKVLLFLLLLFATPSSDVVVVFNF